jgi:hypothetical protein
MRRKVRYNRWVRKVIYVKSKEDDSKFVLILKLIPPILLVIVTILLAYYTYKLAKFASTQSEASISAAKAAKQSAEAALKSVKIAEENINIARQSLTVVNRAYVWVDKFKIKKFMLDNKAIVEVKFHNYGATPAYGFNGTVSMKFTRTKLGVNPRIVKEQEQILSKSVLSSDQTTHFTVHSKRTISTEHKQALKERRLFWYIYGKVEYDDIFGTKHMATFCAEYKPEKAFFVFCDKYNVQM